MQRRDRRGVRGGKRAHQKHHGPSQAPRRVAALTEAAQAEDKLNRTIAAQEAEAARQVEQQAAADRRARAKAAAARKADAEAKRRNWNLGQARALVRQGYSPQQASTMSGWPVKMLEDAERIFE